VEHHLYYDIQNKNGKGSPCRFFGTSVAVMFSYTKKPLLQFVETTVLSMRGKIDDFIF